MPDADDPPIVPGLARSTATRLALGLLFIGLLWRTVRYLLQFPIWGDEALLAMNFAWFDYAQLTQRLENCQIAPLLFLWGERAAFTWLGPSELSMRLVPFLAGCLSLGLFWRLTGLLLEPAARVFAVGFLAVAFFPVAMTTLLKPYSLDLLMALALLLPAVQWLHAPAQKRWLIALTLLAPVALLSSYPAVFVAGGVSLALCRRAWRQGWPTRCWFAAYQVTLLAGFFLASAIGANQLSTSTGGTSTQVGMTYYWSHGFPPSSPWAWPAWFALSTTGQMAAYPIGDANGGSTLTVLFCLVGAVFLWRRRERSSLILFSAPLFLNLVAAALHRYPYGAAARLSQHLAPGLCILAGLGLAVLIGRAQPAARIRWSFAAAALFASIGLGGLVRDVARPYYSPGAAWMRTAMKQMRAAVPGTDWVVVCGDSDSLECVFVWYWLTAGDRITWKYRLPVRPDEGQVWGFHQGAGADAACRQLKDRLVQQDPSWRLARRIPYVYHPQSHDAPQCCELFCFEHVGPDKRIVSSDQGPGATLLR